MSSEMSDSVNSSYDSFVSYVPGNFRVTFYQRMTMFGLISIGISVYLFQTALYMKEKRSFTKSEWIPEYILWIYDENDVHHVLMQFDYFALYDMVKLLLLGSVNIFFYCIFLMDILTLCGGIFSLIDWLPFVLGLVDMSENVLLFLVFLFFPQIIFAGKVVGYITFTKWILTFLVLACSVVGLLSYPFRATSDLEKALLQADKKKIQ